MKKNNIFDTKAHLLEGKDILNKDILQEKTTEPVLVTSLLKDAPTLQYRQRLLYSKYDPKKTINLILQKLYPQKDTCFVCFCPALFYGLEVLLQKIKQIKNDVADTNCYILFLEKEKPLYDFSFLWLKRLRVDFGGVDFCFFNDIKQIDFEGLENKRHFKHIIRLDFSRGVDFHKEGYDRDFIFLQEQVSCFWKNKLVLIKFARLYAKNILKNLTNLVSYNRLFPTKKNKEQKQSCFFDVHSISKTVNKPILVCGAGESLVQTLKSIKKTQKNYFILCVDQVASVLASFGIHIDGIVTVDCQFACQEMFYYNFAGQKDTTLYADLCSWHKNRFFAGQKVFYFLSQYTKANYIEDLKTLFPGLKVLKPMGSVGLVAVALSLILRKGACVRVFFTGLDFCFSLGQTHATGTTTHTKRLLQNNILNPIENYAACFTPGAFKTKDKNNKTVFTTKVLQSYAFLFAFYFAKTANLFDIRNTGIDLGLPFCDICDIDTYNTKNTKTTDAPCYTKQKTPQSLQALQTDDIKKLDLWLKTKKQELKEILSFLEPPFLEQATLEPPENKKHEGKSLQALLKQNDYLYLHFPDTFCADVCVHKKQDFLNRVAVETRFFEKIF